MQFNNTVIKGIGKSLPSNKFSNDDIVNWHGKKSADWIYEKIGVKYRYSFYDYNKNQTNGEDEDELAVNASVKAIKEAKMTIEDVDAIIMTTSTPTHLVFPDSACTLHKNLDARLNTSALTLTSGCAGTLNGLMLGSSLIESDQANNVLVCGTSSMSSFFRPHLKDKIWLHSSIFGDGVASIILSKSEEQNRSNGFTKFMMGADQNVGVAKRMWGGSKRPIDPYNVNDVLNDYLEIDFRKVPSNLNSKFSFIYDYLRTNQNINIEDIDWILFNMSNSVIQSQWINENNIDQKKAFFNMETHGNCAAASLGIVLHDFVKTNNPKKNDIALIMSVGTGLQYGGVFYRF